MTPRTIADLTAARIAWERKGLTHLARHSLAEIAEQLDTLTAAIAVAQARFGGECGAKLADIDIAPLEDAVGTLHAADPLDGYESVPDGPQPFLPFDEPVGERRAA